MNAEDGFGLSGATGDGIVDVGKRAQLICDGDYTAKVSMVQLDRVAVSLMNPIHMTELVVKTWAIVNKLTNIAAE